ncbi:MAG: DsrE family protein [Gammaproteobacteria bacterium]|nr:DsrE family protein [Gammaproteobacteria bacterium]
MKISMSLLTIVLMMGTAHAETYKVAIHVDENDPAVMNMALNNAQNVEKYYEAQGDDVIVEVVAYGPGLNMFKLDSPVAARIDAMSLDESYAFSACGNTHRKMSEKAGKDVPLLEGAQIVPSGVVRLIELQREGYAYIRP